MEIIFTLFVIWCLVVGFIKTLIWFGRLFMETGPRRSNVPDDRPCAACGMEGAFPLGACRRCGAKPDEALQRELAIIRQTLREVERLVKREILPPEAVAEVTRHYKPRAREILTRLGSLIHELDEIWQSRPQQPAEEHPPATTKPEPAAAVPSPAPGERAQRFAEFLSEDKQPQEAHADATAPAQPTVEADAVSSQADATPSSDNASVKADAAPSRGRADVAATDRQEPSAEPDPGAQSAPPADERAEHGADPSEPQTPTAPAPASPPVAAAAAPEQGKDEAGKPEAAVSVLQAISWADVLIKTLLYLGVLGLSSAAILMLHSHGGQYSPGRFAAFPVLTVAVLGLAMLVQKVLQFPRTTMAFVVLACVLMPLHLYAAHAFRILHIEKWEYAWGFTALLCAVVYWGVAELTRQPTALAFALYAAPLGVALLGHAATGSEGLSAALLCLWADVCIIRGDLRRVSRKRWPAKVATVACTVTAAGWIVAGLSLDQAGLIDAAMGGWGVTSVLLILGLHAQRPTLQYASAIVFGAATVAATDWLALGADDAAMALLLATMPLLLAEWLLRRFDRKDHADPLRHVAHGYAALGLLVLMLNTPPLAPASDALLLPGVAAVLATAYWSYAMTCGRLAVVFGPLLLSVYALLAWLTVTWLGLSQYALFLDVLVMGLCCSVAAYWLGRVPGMVCDGMGRTLTGASALLCTVTALVLDGPAVYPLLSLAAWACAESVIGWRCVSRTRLTTGGGAGAGALVFGAQVLGLDWTWAGSVAAVPALALAMAATRLPGRPVVVENLRRLALAWALGALALMGIAVASLLHVPATLPVGAMAATFAASLALGVLFQGWAQNGVHWHFYTAGVTVAIAIGALCLWLCPLGGTGAWAAWACAELLLIGWWSGVLTRTTPDPVQAHVMAAHHLLLAVLVIALPGLELFILPFNALLAGMFISAVAGRFEGDERTLLRIAGPVLTVAAALTAGVLSLMELAPARHALVAMVALGLVESIGGWKSQRERLWVSGAAWPFAVLFLLLHTGVAWSWSGPAGAALALLCALLAKAALGRPDLRANISHLQLAAAGASLLLLMVGVGAHLPEGSAVGRDTVLSVLAGLALAALFARSARRRGEERLLIPALLACLTGITALVIALRAWGPLGPWTGWGGGQLILVAFWGWTLLRMPRLAQPLALLLPGFAIVAGLNLVLLQLGLPALLLNGAVAGLVCTFAANAHEESKNDETLVHTGFGLTLGAALLTTTLVMDGLAPARYGVAAVAAAAVIDAVAGWHLQRWRLWVSGALWPLAAVLLMRHLEWAWQWSVPISTAAAVLLTAGAAWRHRNGRLAENLRRIALPLAGGATALLVVTVVTGFQTATIDAFLLGVAVAGVVLGALFVHLALVQRFAWFIIAAYVASVFGLLAMCLYLQTSLPWHHFAACMTALVGVVWLRCDPPEAVRPVLIGAGLLLTLPNLAALLILGGAAPDPVWVLCAVTAFAAWALAADVVPDPWQDYGRHGALVLLLTATAWLFMWASLSVSGLPLWGAVVLGLLLVGGLGRQWPGRRWALAMVHVSVVAAALLFGICALRGLGMAGDDLSHTAAASSFALSAASLGLAAMVWPRGPWLSRIAPGVLALSTLAALCTVLALLAHARVPWPARGVALSVLGAGYLAGAVACRRSQRIAQSFILHGAVALTLLLGLGACWGHGSETLVALLVMTFSFGAASFLQRDDAYVYLTGGFLAAAFYFLAQQLQAGLLTIAMWEATLAILYIPAGRFFFPERTWKRSPPLLLALLIGTAVAAVFFWHAPTIATSPEDLLTAIKTCLVMAVLFAVMGYAGRARLFYGLGAMMVLSAYYLWLPYYGARLTEWYTAPPALICTALALHQLRGARGILPEAVPPRLMMLVGLLVFLVPAFVRSLNPELVYEGFVIAMTSVLLILASTFIFRVKLMLWTGVGAFALNLALQAHLYIDFGHVPKEIWIVTTSATMVCAAVLLEKRLQSRVRSGVAEVRQRVEAYFADWM